MNKHHITGKLNIPNEFDAIAAIGGATTVHPLLATRGHFCNDAAFAGDHVGCAVKEKRCNGLHEKLVGDQADDNAAERHPATGIQRRVSKDGISSYIGQDNCIYTGS